MTSFFDLSTLKFPDWYEVAVQELATEYCTRGYNFLTAKEYIEARSAYQVAIECNPKLGLAYSGVARAEYQLGNYQAALVMVNLALECDTQLDFYYQRALVTKALNEDEFELLEPAPPRTSRKLGEITHHRTQEDRCALASFDRHIESYPHDPYGYCYRGMCYEILGEYLLACDDFERAISLKPDESLFHHARGRTHEHLDNLPTVFSTLDIV